MIKSRLLSSLKILAVAVAVIAAGYYSIAMRDLRKSMERTFAERVNLVSTYISMVQQQVDGMSRTVSRNYGRSLAPETTGVRFYGEYGVWGLSGYREDKGVEKLAGTCTGIGTFPLPLSVKKELSAAISIDSEVESILIFNKNVTWIYYTSAEKFLYLAPKLRISEYQFSLAEYKRPFWSQAVPENNPDMKQIISDLYEDSVGKGLMITISSPVQANGEFIGVMSLDLGTDLLKELSMTGYIPGETILVDENGRIVARMGEFLKEEQYPLIPLPGAWYSGKDGFFWMRSEVGGGELNMLHRIKKSEYYIIAAGRSLFIWSLALFMIILFILVNRDIVLRKREAAAIEKSMNAIAESRERLQTIISNLPGFVYRCAYDSDWTMFLISEGCEDITGYSPDELINNRIISFNDIIDRDYQQQIWNLWIIAIRERKVFESEYPVHNKNGEMRWVWERGRGIYSEKGEVLFLEGFITDITERKQTDETLIIFRETVENSTDAIGISSPRGRHYYQNRAFADLFGDIGEVPAETVYADKQTGEDVFKTIMSGGQWVGEVQMYSKDRSILDIYLRAYANRDINGKITALVGIHTDITLRKKAEAERVRLQEQLSQAHKMESVGRLAGGVAHDFNNMLGVIIGQSELAIRKCDRFSPVYQRLVEIDKAARRSAELTSQLLAFARKQTVSPKVIDLNESISGMISMLRRLIGEEIELKWRPGEDLWPVRIDPSQVNQILANLCVNARDAITGSGGISIETRNLTVDDKESVHYTESVPGDFVILKVSDTGSGMSREAYEHIFEPFFTTKGAGKGTGLGLAMVYGIIRQNNGHVSVESNPGEGTLFTICFPRDHGTAIRDEVPEYGNMHEGSYETILLVEDEPMLLEMSRTMIEELGYSVVAAASPAEAISIAERENGIKLLVTDVIMPLMNGRELAERISMLIPEIRTVFMSGYTADIIAHHGVLDEGVNFIQKPFKINELADSIKKALS